MSKLSLKSQLTSIWKTEWLYRWLETHPTAHLKNAEEAYSKAGSERIM